MKIQPVKSWLNGTEVEATEFILSSVADDLSTKATFQYNMLTDLNEFEKPVLVLSAYLTIDGQDYQDWDSSPSANDWVYNWAAAKLNLVLIPD
jgi:hypothetical protein